MGGTTELASSQGTNVRELKGQRAIGKEMFLVEQGKKLRGYGDIDPLT